MADSNIGSLPAAVSIDDDSLLVAEQQGEAVQFKGKQLREFAESAAANVKKGDKGDPGEDFKILGYFSTLDALKAAVTTPNAGNAYGVGTVAPYTIYVWDGVNLEWKDNGTIQGPSGATFTPSVDGSGNLSWTNDGGLDNPETVNIKGGKGDPFTYNDFTEEQLAALKGKQGDTGTTFTPSVDSEGNLSWSNDGNKDNPETVNIKGNKGDPFTYEDFTEEQLKALTGPQGSSIKSIARTSGTGAPGTTDTYTVTMTDGSTQTFQVYNGKDGEGAGDMTASVYDKQGKKTDIFQYVDNAIAAIPTPDVGEQIGAHNTDTDAHNDIRLLITELTTRFNALANSEDVDLDQLAELVTYIKDNRSLIEQITTNKVNVSDIIDNLTTNVSNKPLSAAQGVALKALIDGLSNGKLDVAAIADWAKASTKPTYTKSEVGLGNVDNVKQYSASNPPPYPVTSVNGQTGDVEIEAGGGVTANEASATLTTSGWTTHSVLGYQQTVTVTGITAAAKAISTDVELSTTDKDSNTAILAAYALIAANPATPGANALTFYAESIPEVNVPVVVGWL